MSDVNITISVDKRDVVSAIKETNKFENSIKLLGNSLEKGRISSTSYAKGILEIKRQVAASGLSHQKASSEVMKYAKAQDKSKVQSDWFTAQQRKLKLMEGSAVIARRVAREEAAAQREVNAANRESARQAEKLAVEKERLAQKYQPLLAAGIQYKRALLEINKAQEIGILTTKQHEAAVASLNSEYNSFKAGTADIGNRFAQGINLAGKSANRTGMAVQQLGYQVGDFAVQVQSGQSVLVAFSQQATQLAGVLPMVSDSFGMSTRAAIAMSAGLGIAIPVVTGLVGLFLSTRRSSDEAGDGIETFEDKLKSARQEILDTAEALKLINSGFSNSAEQVLNTAVEKAREGLSLALQELERSESLISQFSVQSRSGEASDEQFRANILREIVLERQEELRVAVLLNQSYERAKELTEGQNSLITAGREATLERNRVNMETIRQAQEHVRSLELVLRYGEDSVEVVSARAEQEAIALNLTTKNQEEYVRLAIAAYETTKAIEASVEQARLLNNTDVSSGITEAANEAGRLLGNLAAAASYSPEVNSAIMRRNIASGALPPEAAGDIPETSADRALAAAGEAARARYRASQRESSGGSRGRSSGGSSSGGGASQAQKTLEEIEREIEAREKLAAEVGREGDELRMVSQIKSALGDSAKRYDDEAIRASADRIVAIQYEIEAFEKLISIQQSLTDNITGAMADGLLSIVDRTKTVEQAFRDMAKNIIKELYEVIVMQRVVGSFDSSTGKGSGLSGFIGGLVKGGLGGSIVPHAKGGVVTSPTMFPMGGNNTGLMGEAGPEAIMPLSRASDGSLGVKVSGGESNVTVYQTFSFSANGDDSVKKIIAQAAPQIAQMTKKSLLDDRRRGGTTKSTFG